MGSSDLNFLKTRVGRGAALALAYLAMALAMSYPLILHLRSYAFAGLEDGSMSIWNVWWMKFSIFQLGGNPLNCDYLFFPGGVNLTFHSLPKVLGLISVPLQYLAGLTITYNFVILLTFVLTGLSTYWLVFYLVGERLPAFLAGAFFALSPFRWDNHPHLQLLSTMLIPVYILMVIKGRHALASSGRRPWLYFTLAGGELGVIAYDTEYYSIFLIIFSAIYLFFYFPVRLSLKELKLWGKLLMGLAGAGTIFAVLYTPMLLAGASELAQRGDYVTFPPSYTVYYEADVLSFFVPQVNSQFLGQLFDFVNREPFTYTDTTFLGWLPVLLALVGLWRFRHHRQAWLWALMALVFAVLALGPFLMINGELKNIRAPYLLITKLPLINSARVPARFGVMTMLAVAVLAGYGASALFCCLRRFSRGQVWVPLATGIILAAMFIEFKPLPDLTATAAPLVYSEIARSNIPGAVLSIPLGWEAANDGTGLEKTFIEIFQAEHQRPMVGGMVARAPKEEVFKGIYTPVLDFLADPVKLEPSDLDRDPVAIARFKEHYQVAFIVVHKLYPEIYGKGGRIQSSTELTPEALRRVDNYVTQYLGMEKFEDNDEVAAYRRS